MAKALRRLSHEVSFVSLRDGPLRAAFISANAKEDVRPDEVFDLYVANTILSVPTALRLSPSLERVVAWIHESVRGPEMAELSARELLLHELKYAAFPSRFQMREFRPFMRTTRFFLLRNCVEQVALPEPSGEKPYFVAVGCWSENKNQVAIVELMQRCGILGNVAFIGAGRPEYLRNSGHRFVGQVPNDESREIIARSRGLLSASLSETQNRSAIEAARSGRPVMLSDIPGHRELRTLIRDINLFDPSDPESFRSALFRLEKQLGDDSVRYRLQGHAVKYFGEETFTRELKRLIDLVTRGITNGYGWNVLRKVSKSVERIKGMVVDMRKPMAPRS
ncbi:MAG: glycosyltransferase family 4 protein [Roseiarcus sp.]|jgi:glycosyltransferase involved in cell wall biosynthesis